MNDVTNTDAIAAMQFLLIALIASHPNKKELLAQFDKLSSEHTVAAIALGGGMPQHLRDALEKYRAQIEAHL
jgi:hypothetical protein